MWIVLPIVTCLALSVVALLELLVLRARSRHKGEAQGGYLATLVGCAVGSVLGLIIGSGLMAIPMLALSPESPSRIPLAVLCSMIGLFAGTLSGGALGYRVARRRGARRA